VERIGSLAEELVNEKGHVALTWPQVTGAGFRALERSGWSLE